MTLATALSILAVSIACATVLTAAGAVAAARRAARNAQRLQAMHTAAVQSLERVADLAHDHGVPVDEIRAAMGGDFTVEVISTIGVSPPAPADSEVS